MTPPDIYPEGIPFFDARPPQDDPDRLQDDTTLQSVTGGFIVAPPGQLYPNGQAQQAGAFSPQMLVENPTPIGPNVLSDDITFITGKVGFDWVPSAPGPTVSVPANARVVAENSSDERVLFNAVAPMTGPVRVTSHHGHQPKPPPSPPPSPPPPPPSPPPSPPPPPPPPPPPSYPLGVIAAGLQSVYNNRTTAGLTGSLLYNPADNFDLLPEGTGNNDGNIDPIGPVSLLNWSFAGYMITVVTGLTTGNTEFAGPVTDTQTLVNGGTVGAVFKPSNCLFDGVGVIVYDDALINGSYTNIEDVSCRWQNSPNNFCTLYLDSSFTGGYMGLPGANGNATPGSHTQSLHLLQGNFTISEYFFDWAASGVVSPGNPLGGTGIESNYNAIIAAQAETGNVSVVITNTILGNEGGHQFQYTVRSGSNPGVSCTVSIGGCAISKGLTDYVLAEAGGSPPAPAVVIDLGGNYDYDTGELLDLNRSAG